MRELDELKKGDRPGEPPEAPKNKPPYLLIFTLGVLVFLALFGYFRVWKGKEAEPPLDEIIPIETMPVPDGTTMIDPSGFQEQIPFPLPTPPPSTVDPAATPVASLPAAPPGASPTPIPLTTVESLKEKEPPPLSLKQESPPKPARKSPPTPSKPKQTKVSTESGWTIQVGAFSERGAAVALEKRLQAKGYEAYILKSMVPEGVRWRVRVGHFPDRASAEPTTKKLKEKEGFDPFITAEEKP